MTIDFQNNFEEKKYWKLEREEKENNDMNALLQKQTHNITIYHT